MKINSKDAMIGLLMLGTALTATVACNSQKNNKTEVPVEDTVKIDSTIKNQSDTATAIFKAEQTCKQMESIANEIKNYSTRIKAKDVKFKADQTCNQMDSIANEIKNGIKK